MAFGFIKKVFSFGRKDEPVVSPPAVEGPDVALKDHPGAEAPPLPDFLRRAPEEELSDAAALTESPVDDLAPAPQADAEPAADRIVADPPAAAAPTTVEDNSDETTGTTPQSPLAPDDATQAGAIPEPEPTAPTLPGPPEAERSLVPEVPVAPASAATPEPDAEPARQAAPDIASSPVAADPPPAANSLAESVSPAKPTALPDFPAHPATAQPAAARHETPAPALATPPSVFAPVAQEPAQASAFAATSTHPPVPAPAPPAKDGGAGKVIVGKVIAPKLEPAAEAAPEPRKTWFQRLREGLSRSSRELTGGIAGIFTKRKLDEETLEELEDVLLRADLGMETAIRVTDALSASRYGKDVSDTDVRMIMAQEVEKVLRPVAIPLELDLSHKPHVILVVGVNGTGKTTTIGKLAAKLTSGGLSVMLAAGDTFRAAAIEQLKIWGERTGSPVVSSKIGADAAGLAWDAFEKAKAAGSDVLIIDTAGRLQNRTELMAELEKIVRVLGKHDPEAPHTVLQTVDATTGQNALNQVEIFRNVAGVNGLVMTKLDGTARGGILVAIAAKHRLPVYFIGVGEQVDDLEPFSASDFAKAIAGVS